MIIKIYFDQHLLSRLVI